MGIDARHPRSSLGGTEPPRRGLKKRALIIRIGFCGFCKGFLYRILFGDTIRV